MYSTEGEQEPVVKQPQKALKIPKFVDTGIEDEQEPTVKQPQKANEDPQETSPASVKPAKIPNFAAASCTYILTKGVRKQTNMTNLILPYFPCTLCINHTTMSPAIKTITTHICLAANPTVFLRKLKAAPTTLPMIAGNSSAAFPARLLSASASLSNHPFLSFGEQPPVPPPPPPKAPSMARTMLRWSLKGQLALKIWLLPCSRNSVRIFSNRDVS